MVAERRWGSLAVVSSCTALNRRSHRRSFAHEGSDFRRTYPLLGELDGILDSDGALRAEAHLSNLRCTTLAETPDPIDIAVGARVRLRRRSLGISQSALADALAVSFQPVQKYWRGH